MIRAEPLEVIAASELVTEKREDRKAVFLPFVQMGRLAHPMIAPVLIYDRFSSFGLKYARPAAVLFIIVALIVFTVLRLLSERKKTTEVKEEYADS